jgi:hypothetical protein
LKLVERLFIASTRLADMAAAIACAVPLYAAIVAYMDAIRSLEGVTANVGDVLSACADARLIAEGFLLVLNDAGHEIDASVIATQYRCVTLRLHGDRYGAFRVLACLLTGSGREMFLTQPDNEILLKHQQAAAETGGTYAG